MRFSRSSHLAQRWGLPVLILVLAILAAARCAGAGPLTVLVTGFEPFGGLDRNPTQELALAVQRGEVLAPSGMRLEAVVLPVAYFACNAALDQALERVKPDVVLALGLAGSSPGVRLETTARNQDRGFADNAGNAHRGPVEEGGPATLGSGLPLERLRQSLSRRGVPARLSDDAGGYVCNHLFYHLMRAASARPGLRAGFVHLPDCALRGPGGAVGILTALLEGL
jgi:pyroglutamyl-peptidase